MAEPSHPGHHWPIARQETGHRMAEFLSGTRRKKRKDKMRLLPNEQDKLLLHNAGFLAQKRLARGLRLNHPESVALIASQILEFIRDGRPVAELMDVGRRLLGRNQVGHTHALLHQGGTSERQRWQWRHSLGTHTGDGGRAGAD